MSRMSELMIEIEERLIAGQSMDAIAEELKVPLDWIEGVTELVSESDGQPDEAQEWHDFDPDCQPVSKPPGQSEKDC